MTRATTGNHPEVVQMLHQMTADNMTVGALRPYGWRFYPDVVDSMTLGELRARSWAIFEALCEARQGAGAPLLASAALPASLPPPTPAVVPARPAAPPVSAAPVATIPPLSLEDLARMVWHSSPETRAEFQNNLGAWLAWNVAYAAGRAKTHGGPGTAERQVAAVAAPPAVDPSLPLEQRAAAEWRHSPGLRAEFRQLNHYVAFRRAEERGQVRRLAPAHRIAPGDSVGAR